MIPYYCKNCNHLLAYWDIKNEKYCCFSGIYEYESRESLPYTIDYVKCRNCNEVIGFLFYYICINCFGPKIITKEKDLQNFFHEYINIKYDMNNYKYLNPCLVCKQTKFRFQYWFFEGSVSSEKIEIEN